MPLAIKDDGSIISLPPERKKETATNGICHFCGGTMSRSETTGGKFCEDCGRSMDTVLVCLF